MVEGKSNKERRDGKESETGSETDGERGEEVEEKQEERSVI